MDFDALEARVQRVLRDGDAMPLLTRELAQILVCIRATRRTQALLEQAPVAYGDKTASGHWYFCQDHRGPYPADTHTCRLFDIAPLLTATERSRRLREDLVLPEKS